MKGLQLDGHKYIKDALQHGDVAVVLEDMPKMLNPAITYI